MIYDDDILFGKTADTPGSPRLQIKEVLGIGFQVNFDAGTKEGNAAGNTRQRTIP